MSNLATRLTTTAAAFGDRPAIRLDDEVITYAEFADRAARVVAWYAAQGIGPGDRVGLVFPNVPAFPLHYYGALMAGAIVIPMNPLLTKREVEYYLTNSGAAHVIALEEASGAARLACEAAGVPITTVGAMESLGADLDPVAAPSSGPATTRPSSSTRPGRPAAPRAPN